MNMKFRVTSLLAALLVLPLLLISTNTRHQVMASPMPDMMKNAPTKVSDCLSACGNQLQPTVTGINQREVEKEKEPKPEPAEPYYIQFLQFAPYIGLIGAAYSLRHLRWRPPDIIKLTAAYRF